MRYIDADALMEDLRTAKPITETEAVAFRFAYLKVKDAPTVDVQPVKRGKWMEKHHAYSDEENPIEEWQTCKCSECGRYDTRPYLYYFSEPRFCSWCGADMRGEKNDD